MSSGLYHIWYHVRVKRCGRSIFCVPSLVAEDRIYHGGILMTSPTTSWLAREIASQPAVIEELLAREIPHVAEIVARLPPFSYIVIAARGSSDHAATYAVYAWAALAGWPVALAAPSLYTLYGTPP